MTAAPIETIHGRYAAITQHEAFTADGTDLIVVGHARPDCGFADRAIEWLPGVLPTDNFLPCRYCVDGDTFRPTHQLPTITDEERKNRDAPKPAARDDDRDSTPVSPEERIVRLIAFVRDLGRRAEIVDIDVTVKRDAETWLRRYDGTFDFLVDIKAKGRMSVGQAKGVVNCIRAALNRGESGQPVSAPQAAAPAVDMPAAPQVPAVRTNRYDGRCDRCGGVVKAGEGDLRQVGGKWVTAHLDACPEPVTRELEVPGYDAKRGDVHVVDGTYYRIHVAQGTGRPYAVRADIVGQAVWADGKIVSSAQVRWEYDRNMIARLSEATRATAQQAAAFGHLVGRCCFCSHEIDTPESTAVGYGPVCAAKYDLPWGNNPDVLT